VLGGIGGYVDPRNGKAEVFQLDVLAAAKAACFTEPAQAPTLWDGRAKPLIAGAAESADARPSFLFGQHGNRVIADHLLEFQFKIVNLLRISGIS